MKDPDQIKDTDQFLNDLEKSDKKPAFKKPATVIEDAPTKLKVKKKLSQGQKFFLALLFFILVLIFGFFIMLITNSMVIPT